MKSLFFSGSRSHLLSFAFVLMFLFGLNFSMQANGPQCVQFLDAIEIIIIEGEMARVNTQDDNVVVSVVQVFDTNATLEFEDAGCNSSYCEYDLSSLNSGQHLVKVYTSDGQIYNRWIYLN